MRLLVEPLFPLVLPALVAGGAVVSVARAGGQVAPQNLELGM
ncbi:MAG: hypothetical protein WCA46_00295 [Actinocatenispora sp.]